jgi:hypothetical protein
MIRLRSLTACQLLGTSVTTEKTATYLTPRAPRFGELLRQNMDSSLPSLEGVVAARALS